MSLGLLFWVIYIICVLFGIWANVPLGPGNAKPFGVTLILFVLVGILGWKVFGPAIHG